MNEQDSKLSAALGSDKTYTLAEQLELARARAAYARANATRADDPETKNTDLPSPFMDAAIRAAARRAVSAGPHPYERTWFSRNRIPLAAAAVMVLTGSLVVVMQVEEPNQRKVELADAMPAPTVTVPIELPKVPTTNAAETSAERTVTASIAPMESASRPSAVPLNSPQDRATARSTVAPSAVVSSAAAPPPMPAAPPARNVAEQKVASAAASANMRAAEPTGERSVVSDDARTDARRERTQSAESTSVLARSAVPPVATAAPAAPAVAAAPPPPAPAVQASAGVVPPPAPTAAAPAPAKKEVNAAAAPATSSGVAPEKAQRSEMAKAAPQALGQTNNEELIERWIKRMLDLQKAGETEKLREELRSFRATFPKRELPKSLVDVK
jgi:hypothetical protein